MTTLRHSQFGLGSVISQDSKTVTVNFNGDVKHLMIKYANLINEDGSLFIAQKVKKVKVVRETFENPIGYRDERNNTELLKAVLKNKRTGEWA